MFKIHQDHAATYEHLRLVAANEDHPPRIWFEPKRVRASYTLEESYFAVSDAVDIATQEGFAAPITDTGLEFLQALALQESAEFIVDGYCEDEFDADDAALMVHDALHGVEYCPPSITKWDLN